MRIKPSPDHFKLNFRYFNEERNEYEIEMIWCVKKKEVDTYVVANVPIYVPSVALGDVVEGEMIDEEFYATMIVAISGNSTIRILFHDKKVIKSTIDKLNQLGCSTEVSNIPHLIGVNIPKTIDYFNLIKPFLDNGESNNVWEYQEGCLGHSVRESV